MLSFLVQRNRGTIRICLWMLYFCGLHDDAAAAGLLRCVGVLTLRNRAPDRGGHVVSRAVAVGNDTLSSGADGDALPIQILAEAVVKLRQAAKLQVGHGLLRLLDLRRIADITGGVLRHGGGFDGAA